MSRALLLFMLLLVVPNAAFSADSVPTSYAECKADAPYTKKTELECVYLVPEDKDNGQKTKDYFACQLSKPNYRYLKTYDCSFATKTPDDVIKVAQCTRDKLHPALPGFTDDCRLFFYNTAYVFPASFKDCMAKEDHKEDVTDELKKICNLTVTYVPETGKEYFDAKEADAFIEKCQIAGGEAKTSGKPFYYQTCTMSYDEP